MCSKYVSNLVLTFIFQLAWSTVSGRLRQRGRERIFLSRLCDGHFKKDGCLTGFSLSHSINLLFC